MITRRFLLATTASLAVVGVPSARADGSPVDAARALAQLEDAHGGRLGVCVLDATGRALVAHRGDERFALCSTFKVLAAALVLARVARGQDTLDRRIVFAADALQPYAPITRAHVGPPGLTIEALCEAAVVLSDNTAANLLLASFGGPAALTAWLRTIGDDITRLDNNEPTLNDVPPGETHDTTTPNAVAGTLRRLVLGTVLDGASRDRLTGWMVRCQTGLTQLRAGAPPGWRVGDKTGSFRTTVNDVAVLWPPTGPARVVTAYYNGGAGSDDDRKAVLAAVGRIAAAL